MVARLRFDSRTARTRRRVDPANWSRGSTDSLDLDGQFGVLRRTGHADRPILLIWTASSDRGGEGRRVGAMLAVVLDEHGGPEVLTLREVPDPAVGPEEVLVDVVATALNRADLLQRRGFYPGPPMPHEIPGMELSGRVSARGERATAWSIGDPVMGIVGGGAYAERIAVHERQLMAVPRSVSLADAAAIPEVWITAFDALVLQGGLASGGVALVHAGASGVGTAAIQIARAIGARVAVTTSTAKTTACADLGADLVIDYTTDDFVPACRELTGGRGIDVVLDVIGGDYVDRNIDVLRVGGRVVQVGVMGGGSTTVNVGMLLPKRATLVGTVLRARPIEEKISVTQRFARQVLPLFDGGSLRPVIDSRFPLAEIAAAHERMESNANVGKIVIDVSD
jgi:NADPH:quinone reductase